jgi:hypothetical protein
MPGRIFMTDEDDVLGVVEGVSGHTFETRYDLYFTNRRIIAAIVLHPSDLADSHLGMRGLQEMLIGGMPRIQEAKALMKRIEMERRLGFKNKTCDEILRSHKANIEIPSDAIPSGHVSKGLFDAKLEFDIPTLTGTRRLRFQIPRDQFDKTRNLLSLALSRKTI